MAVLTDYQAGDKGKVARLRDSEIMRAGHLFTAHTFTGASEADVEDMLGRDLYAALVAATYGLAKKDLLPATKPADASDRVAVEVREHMLAVSAGVAAFDHFAPAAFLLSEWPTLKTSLPGVDAALDRFEEFFKQVNALLP